MLYFGAACRICNVQGFLIMDKKKKGVFVAFSFGKGAYEEVARAKNGWGLEIELKTVEEILKEV